jgi:hypothetical protein
MALAPMVIGRIADASSLRVGMQAAIAAQLIGGLLFLLVIYFIRRDGLRHPVVSGYHDADAPSSGPDRPPMPAGERGQGGRAIV